MEEIEEPNLIQTLRGHSSEVTCADAYGALLATGGGDRALRLWRWAAGAGWAEERPRRRRAPVRRDGRKRRWAPGGAGCMAQRGQHDPTPATRSTITVAAHASATIRFGSRARQTLFSCTPQTRAFIVD
uniref:Uncharacterized protein n=1 Tax=Heliothis virescens TaxID=7102 RepID=A0A2A4J824_HELVI